MHCLNLLRSNYNRNSTLEYRYPIYCQNTF
uniref:Uncharacterized protein n=1 Tax=Siphoviridae sp. ct2vX3 TaxID=2825318 RepID=A0A8S5PX62_9CAUD|nr:MAG TPA: protein of unknown function (DUF3328) [Siphoviridae sp. ct2vX3]